MYNSLWEDHPKVKQIRAESEAKGKAEGKVEGKAEGLAEGEVQALRSAVVTVVKVRFPDLTEIAQKKVAKINNPDVLKYILEQISLETNVAVALALLRPVD
ncbi:MAG: hypothetical protein E6J21_09250 [Chloroflexota bacterium]|nr:MAG: hypothetical protein E6J21_09250 [Chloroflexota bacterium]